ncbi:bZIP transcription factor [Pestalotiopsis sp. NC0098]|nr:bZIP transcription factor [Pestalotiopsis sp. NC0098]
MVSTYQMPAFYRPNPLSVDTSNAQKYFEEEDSSLMDDSLLDHNGLDSGLEMSPPMAGSRRDSFAVSSTLFSPKTEDWQSVDMQSVPSNNPFLEPQSNNPFMRMDQSQAYAQQGQWNMNHGSGTCTPLQQYDGLAAEYDGGAPVFQQAMPTQTPFTNPTGQVPLFQNVGNNGHSISAFGHQDPKNHQSMAKRMHPDSPPIRSHNELRRGDGIRKKNARFDIPAERNLNNIDQLISQSNDDQEIKELKQQKRLLRNRQAALDSRQRKKMHTERLEDEKKQYTAVISEQEDIIAELNMKLDQLMREKDFYHGRTEVLMMEKEELIGNHTIETGELRKKVSVLTDHVKSLETANMPSNVGYNNAFNEMEMTMDPSSWENMGFMGEFQPMEQDVKQEVQVVPTKKTEIALPSDDKHSSQGGLLFMLFLVGAFVMSNRSAPTIPRVSEDVREASATLLENIFKDAGVAQAPGAVMAAQAPQPSGASWAMATPTPMHGVNMNGIAPSMLGDLSDSLTRPTQEQTKEQLFSMTPAQYNGVTSQDFLQNAPPPSTSRGRRNLAESLATMRNNDKQSAAEVYTRSLLWDQIPRDVVRNFAKMVAEANAQQEHQHGNEAMT